MYGKKTERPVAPGWQVWYWMQTVIAHVLHQGTTPDSLARLAVLSFLLATLITDARYVRLAT